MPRYYDESLITSLTFVPTYDAIWSSWRRRGRRAPLEVVRASMVEMWRRDWQITQFPAFGVPFDVVENTPATDDAWHSFSSINGEHEWPVKVFVPPWAEALKVYFFSGQNGSTLSPELRIKLGGLYGYETFALINYLSDSEGQELSIGSISSLQGTVVDFEIEYKHGAGYTGGALHACNCGDPGALESLTYHRDMLWSADRSYLT